jgi:hypothetical protein
MNAEALIDYICESPKDTIFGYVPRMTSEFGIGCPPKANEDPFVTWVKQFTQEVKLPEEYRQSALERPEEFIDLLLTRHDALIITVLNGYVDVYSRNRHAKKVPKGFLDKVERMLDIWPDADVGWFQSVSANPVATVAAEPIYGLEPADVEYERNRPKMSKEMGMHAKSELRRKFWGAGGYDPSTAPDIVDKLLQ